MNLLKFDPALYLVWDEIPLRKVGGDSPEAGPAALNPEVRFQPFSESALLSFFGDRILCL